MTAWYDAERTIFGIGMVKVNPYGEHLLQNRNGRLRVQHARLH